MLNRLEYFVKKTLGITGAPTAPAAPASPAAAFRVWKCGFAVRRVDELAAEDLIFLVAQSGDPQHARLVPAGPDRVGAKLPGRGHLQPEHVLGDAIFGGTRPVKKGIAGRLDSPKSHPVRHGPDGHRHDVAIAAIIGKAEPAIIEGLIKGHSIPGPFVQELSASRRARLQTPDRG